MQKRFIDEKCAACGEPFAENDDLIVCPECGAPYHRDCYQLSGSCVHKHEHGSYEWKGEKEKLAEHFENISAVRSDIDVGIGSSTLNDFISGGDQDKIGSEENAEDVFSSAEDFPDISERDMKIYLGEAAEHFLPAYRQMKERGKMLHLNFRAFFLSFLYIFYKRLYGFAWGLLLMMSLAFSLFSIMLSYDFSAASSAAMQLALPAILAALAVMIALYPLLFFDYYYLKSSARKIRTLKIMFRRIPSDEMERMLRKEGRSSYTSCIFGTVAFVYLLVIAKTLFTNFLLGLLTQ